MITTLIGAVATMIPTSKADLDEANKQMGEMLKSLKGGNFQTAEEFAKEFFSGEKTTKAEEPKSNKTPSHDDIKNGKVDSTVTDKILNDCNLAFVEETYGFESRFKVTRDRLSNRLGLHTDWDNVTNLLRTQDKVWVKLSNGKILKNY